MKRVVRAGDALIEYTLIQASRRDILIQALEGDVTRVYAPRGARLSDIDALVVQNAGKILAVRETLRPRTLASGDTLYIEGTPKKLVLREGAFKPCLSGGELLIFCPDPENAPDVRARIVAFLSEMALRRIRERVDFFLPQIGGNPVRITVRAQRSRWGSCSLKHNLSFNWRLILAPPRCLDYVVVHELCHLTEFNHSPRFWRMVEENMRDFRVWKDYLKRNGQSLNL